MIIFCFHYFGPFSSHLFGLIIVDILLNSVYLVGGRRWSQKTLFTDTAHISDVVSLIGLIFLFFLFIETKGSFLVSKIMFFEHQFDILCGKKSGGLFCGLYRM